MTILGVVRYMWWSLALKVFSWHTLGLYQGWLSLKVESSLHYLGVKSLIACFWVAPAIRAPLAKHMHCEGSFLEAIFSYLAYHTFEPLQITLWLLWLPLKKHELQYKQNSSSGYFVWKHLKTFKIALKSENSFLLQSGIFSVSGL